ncbi:MAG: M24 family metallopeptidase [Halobacteriota archaeon]
MIENRLVVNNRRSEYYPRFSAEEFERRRETVRGMMDNAGLEALVIYGNSGMNRWNQTNVAYLSNYRGDYLTYLVFFRDPAEQTTLYCGITNHLQYIQEAAVVDDIRLMIPDPPRKLAGRIEEAGITSGSVGLVGLDPRYQYSIPHDHYVTLERELPVELVDFTPEFLTRHAVKSDEEVEWVRRGAELTDIGMEALVEAAEPGVKEYELAAELQYAYLKEGGEINTTFINSAPMEGAEPGEACVWKLPSERTIENGDIITTEFSAAYNGYSGQIHRPIAVGREPTPTYRDMYDVVIETYDSMLGALKAGNTTADVAEAVAPIEESPYKIYDVLLHGFGNGYLPPFIGTHDSNYWPGGDDPLTATWTFEENMVVVVQPNVYTEDETQGFQLGTTVVIRQDGPELLQQYPVEFIRV